MAMIDAVLSYHPDPHTCGVTKFSQQLARRLGVPWGQFSIRQAHRSVYLESAESPLLSVKFSEIAGMAHPKFYDLFLHDIPTQDWETRIVATARRVFTASGEIAAAIRPFRHDVIAAWCPSLVEAEVRHPITVLTMGMANKLQTAHYAALKAQLEATGEPYTLEVSAALHEGTSYQDASASFETLRALFGDRFVFLGVLSDEALALRFRTCTYVAAFFEHGLRENNTSVMAALQAGAGVVTNCDAHTPDALSMLVTDITREVLPRSYVQRAVEEAYGWTKLVELIRHA